MRGILVAGCGRLGGRVAGALAARGEPVWGLRRSAGALPAGVVGLTADLREPSSLVGLPEVEAVVYAASADERGAQAYRDAYVVGQRNLLAALPAPPRRWIFTSSTRVYPPGDGGVVDETSPTAPWHFTAACLLEGEALVRELGPGATTLRLSGLYGPESLGLVDRVRQGLEPLRGDGQRTNRIHVDDAARAVLHVLDLEEPAALYLVSDSDPALRDEVVLWLARRLGVELPRDPEGPPPARSGGGKTCSNRRLLDSGFRLLHPSFRDGYAAILDAG